MTRLQADFLLLLTAIIWGTAFVAQKTALDAVGPLSFAAARLLLSALVVAPLAILEVRRLRRLHGSGHPADGAPALAPLGTPRSLALFLATGLAFCCGSLLQQVGMLTTSVTNTGFLTTVYVVLVPIVVWLFFRRPPAAYVWLAAAFSITGVWLIGDATLSALTVGDLLVLAGAVFWALHVVLVGMLVMRTGAPFLAVFVQYLLTSLIAALLLPAFETFDLSALARVVPELLYAGIVSGAIGFSLQAIAQRHTPAPEAAVIIGSESLFAAMAGALLLGERLSLLGAMGCALVFAAMLIVELTPVARRWWMRRTGAAAV
ncbi:MAG: EamA family transporter [Rhizobiales bacterium]|nr:EamA family transporter [Hyphomicrobiales bacterium]